MGGRGSCRAELLEDARLGGSLALPRMIESRLIVGWFEAHAAALVLYARQWLDASAAEDVVHDVFVRLIAQPRVPDDPPAWLFRSVRNAAISASRSRGRRKRRESNVSRDRREWFETRVDDLIDAKTVEAILETLPADQREIVVLRIWAQLGFQQIAGTLGVSVSTAFEKYKLALAAVRTKLEATRWQTK